jgi:hypothetical protein
MKKAFLLFFATAFSTAAFAQSSTTTTGDKATGNTTKTEVDVRDNGTVKTETTTRTGRTEVGQKRYNTTQDAKRAGKKTGNAVEKGAKKTGRAVKKGANKVGDKVEDIVD